MRCSLLLGKLYVNLATISDQIFSDKHLHMQDLIEVICETFSGLGRLSFMNSPETTFETSPFVKPLTHSMSY